MNPILYPAMVKKEACSRRREEVLLGMWAGNGVIVFNGCEAELRPFSPEFTDH